MRRQREWFQESPELPKRVSLNSIYTPLHDFKTLQNFSPKCPLKMLLIPTWLSSRATPFFSLFITICSVARQCMLSCIAVQALWIQILHICKHHNCATSLEHEIFIFLIFSWGCLEPFHFASLLHLFLLISPQINILQSSQIL